MILLPLLLLALTGATSAPEDRRRRARVRELQQRLSVLPEAGPSSVLRRLTYACSIAPAYERLLHELAVRTWYDDMGVVQQDQLMGREGALPGTFRHPTYRNHPLEIYLPWLATQLARGIRIRDLPWGRVYTQVYGAHDLALAADSPEAFWARVTLVGLPPGPTSMNWFRTELRRETYDHETVIGFFVPDGERGTVVSPLDRAPPRVEMIGSVLARMAKGYSWPRDLHPLPLSLVLRADLPSILDWIEQTRPALSGLTYPAAVEACAAWHVAFSQTVGFGTRVPVYTPDTVLATYPDGSSVVALRSKRGLHGEGVSMGHCVGGYWPEVRDGNTVIWSARDAAGVPEVTLELEPKTGKVRQIHGARDVDPTRELKRYGRALLVLAATHLAQYPTSEDSLGAFGVDGAVGRVDPSRVTPLLLVLDAVGNPWTRADAWAAWIQSVLPGVQTVLPKDLPYGFYVETDWRSICSTVPLQVPIGDLAPLLREFRSACVSFDVAVLLPGDPKTPADLAFLFRGGHGMDLALMIGNPDVGRPLGIRFALVTPAGTREDLSREELRAELETLRIAGEVRRGDPAWRQRTLGQAAQVWGLSWPLSPASTAGGRVQAPNTPMTFADEGEG